MEKGTCLASLKTCVQSTEFRSELTFENCSLASTRAPQHVRVCACIHIHIDTHTQRNKTTKDISKTQCLE